MLESMLNDFKDFKAVLKEEWKQTSIGRTVYYGTMAGAITFGLFALSDCFPKKVDYQMLFEELDKVPVYAFPRH